ncbi:hypothetical protein TNCV_853311 [Trichonephila clavipes]|nr:hypothetical protein TNCV_853311 [Trichonephila clavipes]
MSSSPVPLKSCRVGQQCTLNLSRAETSSRSCGISEFEEIFNVTEEVVDLAKQINLEMDSDDVEELLDFHNPELTIDELMEMQEQDIEELKFVNLIQSEDQMMVENLTEALNLTEKG